MGKHICAWFWVNQDIKSHADRHWQTCILIKNCPTTAIIPYADVRCKVCIANRHNKNNGIRITIQIRVIKGRYMTLNIIRSRYMTEYNLTP